MSTPGSVLQERDVKWLNYLAFGPARFPEASLFYRKTDGKPISPRNIYQRLKELEEAKFIKRHLYRNMERGMFYYIGDEGILDLMSRYGYEQSHIRNKVVPSKHIVHEIILSSVIRKIYQDSNEQGLYKVLFAYDDTVMKKESKYEVNKVYPDLKMRLQPMDGSEKDFLFEIDGLNLRKDRFLKKLAGLKEPLFVVTLSAPRMDLIYRYTHIANKRPPEILISTHHEFQKGGLMGTKWLHYPTRRFLNARFK
jgi:hypothetical protein